MLEPLYVLLVSIVQRIVLHNSMLRHGAKRRAGKFQPFASRSQCIVTGLALAFEQPDRLLLGSRGLSARVETCRGRGPTLSRIGTTAATKASSDVVARIGPTRPRLEAIHLNAFPSAADANRRVNQLVREDSRDLHRHGIGCISQVRPDKDLEMAIRAAPVIPAFPDRLAFATRTGETDRDTDTRGEGAARIRRLGASAGSVATEPRPDGLSLLGEGGRSAGAERPLPNKHTPCRQCRHLRCELACCASDRHSKGTETRSRGSIGAERGDRAWSVRTRTSGCSGPLQTIYHWPAGTKKALGSATSLDPSYMQWMT